MPAYQWASRQRNGRAMTESARAAARRLVTRPDAQIWSDGGIWAIGQSVAALPVASDVELLGNIESVIEFDAEVSDGAFHLGMSEQQLDRPEIAGLAIDQGSLGAPQGVRAIG